MVVHGQIQNGMVVPETKIPLPNGTKVTITVSETARTENDRMSPEALARYHDALRQIDSLPNENPGDSFSGADHDRVLYGGSK